MIYLALDKSNNDLILQQGGGVARVNKGRFIVQQVKCKLNTWLEEWILDPTVGWLAVGDYEKNYDVFDIEDRARAIILGTDGVLAIDSLSSDYKKRVLTLNFSARTIYGTIDLTIPWGVT